MRTDPITDKDAAKRSLERADLKIAKAYADLLKTAEVYGDEIKSEEYAKARFYLDQTIAKVWDKIDVVRAVAKATAGSFSLDSIELRTTTVIQGGTVPVGAHVVTRQTVEASTPIDPAALHGKSLAKAIGGRLTKQAKAEMARPSESVIIDLDDIDADDDLPSSGIADADGDGVDFIDD